MRTEIDLPNKDGLLRQGMYGRVTIHLRQNKEALSIPSTALVGDVNQGQGNMYVVVNGTARLRPIRVGQDNGLRVEVVGGLAVRIR